VAFLLSLLTGLLEGILLLVSYIKSGKVFPEPLKPEAEKKYLKMMNEGNKEARNILIEHNLRLVAHIVKKYDTIHTDNEDLISIGTIGLIKGINTYDNSKSTKLATYAARCIENEILMYFRSIKKLNRETLLQKKIGSDKEGNEITLFDIISSNEESVTDRVEKNINKERLYNKLKELPERQKKVIILRYGLNNGKRLTQKEVASILGISRSYISRIEKKAVNNLTELFFEGENN